MEFRPELVLPVVIALGVFVEKLGDLRAERRRARRRASEGPRRWPVATSARGEAGYERKAA